MEKLSFSWHQRRRGLGSCATSLRSGDREWWWRHSAPRAAAGARGGTRIAWLSAWEPELELGRELARRPQ